MGAFVIGAWIGAATGILKFGLDAWGLPFAAGASLCWIAGILETRRTGQGGGE